jgi:hypothetical protein
MFLPESGYLKILSDRRILELRRLNLGDDEWIRRGTGPVAENYDIWNLTPEGLRITFDVYQAAPNAAGRQAIAVPYRALDRSRDRTVLWPRPSC